MTDFPNETTTASRRRFIKNAMASGLIASSGIIKLEGFTAFAAEQEFDVVVVGSGAAGMTAALKAAHEGLRVVLIEKSSKFGGSTARSGGGIWIRNNEILDEVGVQDTPEEASAYLAAVVGDDVPQAKQAAFLQAGPEMISFVRQTTPLDFRWMKDYSDYYPNFYGAKPEGASIEPEIFDGCMLGEDRDLLEPPYIPTPPGVVVFGGDYKWLTLATVTGTGIATGAKAIGRFVKAKAQGVDPLTMGQALAAGLRVGLKQKAVPVWLETPLLDLSLDEKGHVNGVVVAHKGVNTLLKAKSGVILATGGFERNQAMRKEYQKGPIGIDWTLGSRANEGEGILAGEQIGADLELMDDAWWGPTIPLTKDEPYFCLSERSLPGSIIINGSAQRFVNESSPYHDVVNAMYEQDVIDGELPIWMITDQNYRNRYLFRDVLPALPFPKEWYESGAVTRSWTLKGLAKKIKLSPEALEATVDRFNNYAKEGVDPEFGRGENAYDRYYADPGVSPNPSLGGICLPPFYAFRVVPGDLGTKGGLRTDERSRVLRPNGSPISGLYAAGNASSSVMGRSYAGAGSTIGPAMTFGFIAANDMAQAARRDGSNPS
ncbi:3-oxosteroid 1-dehydrogenase [Pseudobacteriovorax antillogorgiicola]|uniref:3-oxosteroid 1-dehydrogenase n=1 Tax=Pseudobacteriovorax antillogorgiicola TaxID=1513793 RepID=A0A1Y6B9T6_9BACT|nr:3-oxosteroid 1-dehydrogenase [Pseudobacteriovorax antillogorgiicola]TCS57478.1 3-oxosteroid 1-dehydrogenase [Pseudobacteriovorax antillogorgiicola]SMF00565.1 3-oxosteroid 1-dehydrogenase [Pseudobacteriovorax antillogorgiicola]